MKLTQAAVLKLKPIRDKVREVPDHGAAGLRLAIFPSGSRSFVMRFRDHTGRHCKLTLGRAGLPGQEAAAEPQLGSPSQALTLTAARALALTVLRRRDAGIDVVSEHRKRRPVADPGKTNFAAVARRFVEEHAKPTRTWRTTAKVLGLSYDDKNSEPVAIRHSLVDRWGHREISEITGKDVMAVVTEAVADGIPGLEKRTSAPSNARGRSVLKALHKMFNWALGHDLVTANPCAGRPKPPVGKSRERVLDLQEIEKIWRAADALGYPFGPVVKLLILTGCRRSEIDGLRWSELSEDLSVLTLPPERVKTNKQHVVFLPEMARTLISAVPRRDGVDLLFSTNGVTPVSGWSKTKRHIDVLSGVSNWKIHDIRRSFATHLVERGIALPHIVETLIGHASGHKAGVAGTYNRAYHREERMVALEKWAAIIAGVITDRPAQVVALHGGRR